MKFKFQTTWLGGIVAGMTMTLLIGTFAPNAEGAAGMMMMEEIIMDASPADQDLLAQDRAVDRTHLRQIHAAVMAFKKKHGDLPDYLSELFPEFLQDTNVLVSPEHARTGRFPSTSYKDPKLPCSYSYQFSPAPRSSTRSDDMTMKQWKLQQMDEFGEAVPLARIRWEDPERGERSLAITYGGELVETGRGWESDTNLWALLAKLGPTPGTKDARKMRVTVQDLNGQPLAGATVRAVNRQSELGELPPRVSTTDALGQGEVNLGGKRPTTLTLEVSKPGFASEKGRWTSGDDIPEEWTAKLGKAVTVGGFVQDNRGRPISGVTVGVLGTTKDPVGQVVLSAYESVSTGALGQWSCQQVPETFESLSFKLAHPDFMAAEYDQAGEGDTAGNLVKKADLLAGRALLRMEPGIVVEGTVANDKQQALAGAEVTLVWSTGDEDERRTNLKRAKAGQDGRFRFVVTEAAEVNVVAQASGLAPKSEQIEMRHGLKPVSLTLEKGREIKGRALDAEKKPVGGAEVRVTQWNDLNVLRWRTNTDAEGRFRWDAAPLEPFSLSVSRSNFISTWHQVREDQSDVSIQLERAFHLAGRVIDAETKEPLRAFTLTPGYSYSSEEETFRWERYNRQQYKGGNYALSSSNRRGGRVKYVCEADGYLPAATPALKDTGAHTHDFELKRGKGLTGVLQLRSGEPVAGATVILVDKSSSGYMNKAGEFRTDISDSRHVVTDAEGRFQLPPSLEADAVLVAHEKGYAQVPAAQVADTGKVVLGAWGRVSGAVKVPIKPDQNVKVALHSMNYRYAERSRSFAALSLYLDTVPDENGRFVFDQVPPGDRRVYLQYKFREGPGAIPLSHGQFVRVVAGETARITLGGNGRPVIGQVKIRGGEPSDVDWTRDVHTLSPVRQSEIETDSPYGKQFESEAERRKVVEAYQKKLKDYWNSEAGRQAQQNEKSYVLVFDESGAFRAEDVPPGRYTLRVAPTDPAEEQYGYRPLGQLSKEAVVGAPSPGKPDEPVDLGTLELTIRRPLRIGSEAPPFEAKTLDDKPLKLSDYRGKFVVLAFWQAAFSPSLNELPSWKALYEALSKDSRFAMISLSLDQEKKTAQEVVKKQSLRWDQAFLGTEGWRDLAASYNVARVPSAFLIAPDGTVLACDLRGRTLSKVVTKALQEQ